MGFFSVPRTLKPCALANSLAEFRIELSEPLVMISDDCLLVRGSVLNALDHYHQLSSQGSKIGAVAFYWREWPQEQEYKVGLTLGDRMFVNHGMFPRKVLEEIGWVEEDLYRFYHADGDLCLRLWQLEYEVVDCSGAFVEHFRHANSKVRREHLQDQESDWSAYLYRWKGIFYDPDADNTGGWRYCDYKDPYITVKKFPRVPSYMVIIISALERIRRRFT